MESFMYLSNFAFDKCEVSYHCITDDYILNKIYACTIYYANNSIQENGITELKLKLNTLNRVSVDSYEEIDIIRIGKPKALDFSTENSIETFKKILRNNNGIISYWDNQSLAFIMFNYKKTQKKALIEFLNQELVARIAREGLELSLNIPQMY